MKKYIVNNEGYICDENWHKARFWTRTGACNAIAEVKSGTDDINIIFRYPRYEYLNISGFKPKLIVKLIKGAQHD